MIDSRRDLDAALHLLDRQVIDSDDLMVSKVDDLEVSQFPDGRLAITGILVGPAALLPRYAGRSGRAALRFWHRLGVQQANRDRPWRIDLSQIDRIDSAVHLGVPRVAVLRVQELPADGVRRYRFAQLMGLRVTGAGREWGKVLDVRLRERHDSAYDCVSVLVGHAVPGAFLGYERRDTMGPAWLRHTVRWSMRHARHLEISDISDIDWDGGRILAAAAPHEIASR